MKFYLKICVPYILLVVAINLHLDFMWQTILNFFIVACIVCLPEILVAFLVRILPKKVFNANNKLFFVSKKETLFYEKLKIKNWKSKIPEAGKTGGFKKDKLYDPYNPQYIKKFLTESCIAEAIHTLSILWGFFSLLVVPNNLIVPLGFPLILFNVFIHIFPIMIQRYLRPKLIRVLNHLTKERSVEKEPFLTKINF